MTRFQTTAVAVACLTALALLVAAPTAGAANAVKAPPDESGLGRTDVRDEPNHRKDRIPPTNGFPGCRVVPEGGTSCTAEPQLVLESVYQHSTIESSHDINNLLRVLVAGDDVPIQHQDHLYPGDGYFFAYWGWWLDKGGGAWLPAEAADLDEPDGRIDDAHDDRSRWADDPRTGPWDEFVWRGENRWAGDHPMAHTYTPSPLIGSYPDDEMFLFVHPGTHHPREGNGLGLVTGADAGDVADATFQDDTGVSPYAPEPLRQKQGWDGAQGYDFTFTDQSLLVATEATTAVNPSSLPGDDRYNVASAIRADTDLYSAVAPQVETLYRTAVWDPGDEVDGPADPVVGDRGIKGTLRQGDPVGTASTAATDLAYEATYPLSPAAGAADDAAGKAPRLHEPNRPEDRYPGASHDPKTTYGGLADGHYYDPGDDQTYNGYDDRDTPWLDAHLGYGGPAYAILLPFPFNFNAHPAPNLDDVGSQDGDRTQAPGFLYVTAEFGLWWDADDDGWIGRLDDPGRPTRPDDPYRNGRVDDPNDYADTPSNARSQASRQGIGEWRPICENGATLEGALEPGTPDGSWGQAGVYVVQDAQEPGYNPWDDAVADVTGDTALWSDDDGERLSRHVREGPIPFEFKFCSKDRGWSGNKMVYMPTGTTSYNVTMTVEATLGTRSTEDGSAPFTARPTGDDLAPGTTVTDVDVLHDWGVDG